MPVRHKVKAMSNHDVQVVLRAHARLVSTSPRACTPCPNTSDCASAAMPLPPCAHLHQNIGRAHRENQVLEAASQALASFRD